MSIINYNEKGTASIVYKYSFCSISAPIFLFFDKSSKHENTFFKIEKYCKVHSPNDAPLSRPIKTTGGAVPII